MTFIVGEEEIAGVQEWYAEKLKARQDAIVLLREGTPMQKHFLGPLGGRKDHERVISVDEKGNAISWISGNINDANASSQGTDKEIRIQEIEEIVEGTRTKVLVSLTSDHARAACCWSIITQSRTYDFEAHAVSEKERWVDNLRIILHVNKIIAAVEKNRRSNSSHGVNKRSSHRILTNKQR
jgi:hypothetical protein